MKFVCNNCGFTADIPDQMSACPMCGSSNVSSASEISSKLQLDVAENEDENVKSQNFRVAAGPTQRVTLTEGMNIDEQTESNAAKPAEQPAKKNSGKGVKTAAIVVALLVSAAAAAAAYYFFFK